MPRGRGGDWAVIISYSKRFVVFAPWKCASSTLHLRLKDYNESPYSRFFHFSDHLNRVVHQHLTCADFLGLPESRLGLFAGSFVRNPYDRAYSGFLQLQGDMRQLDFPYPAEWIRDLVSTQLADNFAQLARADFDFDRWLASVTEDQVLEAGRNTSFPLHPAHYWTHVGAEQYAAFVGRVERFEQDVDRFCAAVGIAEPDRVNDNVKSSVPLGDGPDRAYRYASRMSRRSVDRINRLFARDFELFGYETL